MIYFKYIYFFSKLLFCLLTMRYNSSVDEYSVNSINISAANGHSDLTTDKVFWDVD